MIQARMGSTRLPGKIMRTLVDDVPLLGVQVTRACVPRVPWWVATTHQPEDDVTHAWSRDHGLVTFRGSVDDVLSRFLAIADETDADWLLRLTGDNPFTHADTVSRLIEQARGAPESVHLIRDIADDRWYPMGFVPEIVRVDRLREIAARPDLPGFHRTHVTSAVPAQHIARVALPGPRRPELRWTIDTDQDLQMCRRLLAALGVAWQTASYEDLLGVVDMDPAIALLNAGVEQKSIEQG